MKNLINYIFLITTFLLAGEMQINFNDGTTTEVVATANIERIELQDITVPEGMIFIEGEVYQMGDYYNEIGIPARPCHYVLLSDFFIGKYEVTQSEWLQYMPPKVYDYGEGDDFPAYYINWYETIVYCNKRSITEGFDPCYSINSSTDPDTWGNVPTDYNSVWDEAECDFNSNGYRLPTEAEWEYAARGGINWTDRFRYSGCDDWYYLTHYCWYEKNSDGSTHQVGTRLPNQVGLYDMSGNVDEWCWDWYAVDYYTYCSNQGTVTDPLGPDTGTERAQRSGSLNTDDTSSQLAYRFMYRPYISSYVMGLRLVRSRK